MGKEKYFILFLIAVNLLSCTSFIKPLDLIAIEEFEFIKQTDENLFFSTTVKIKNPNSFKIKTTKIKSEIYSNSVLIGELIIDNELLIKKNSTSLAVSKLSINIKNLNSYLLNEGDSNLEFKGFATIPFMSHNIGFKYNYNVDSIINSFLNENFSKNIFSIKNLKLKELKKTKLSFDLILNFNSSMGFDLKIKDLSIDICKSRSNDKPLVTTKYNEIINLIEKTPVDIPMEIEIDLLKLAPSLILGVLKNDLNLFMNINLDLVFNNSNIPISINKDILIKPVSSEIIIK